MQEQRETHTIQYRLGLKPRTSCIPCLPTEPAFWQLYWSLTVSPCLVSCNWIYSEICKNRERHIQYRTSWDSNPGPLAYHVSTLPTEPAFCQLDWPLTVSPCLVRSVPDSAQRHARIEETCSIQYLLGLEPRTSRIPCEHSANRASILPTLFTFDSFHCLVRVVPESAQSYARTERETYKTVPPGTRIQDLLNTVWALCQQSQHSANSIDLWQFPLLS